MEDNASGYAMESVDGSFAERGHLNIREMASCRTISTATQPFMRRQGRQTAQILFPGSSRLGR
ncbi:hypothetical protein BGZ61DRAFT_437017 [Ilyonectria robusta]|uniref:uncharacterized protein n=1 Tax=Ilyonectria robusta TaxID=1079257 RepID=UPI001E8E7854|nr:uncharacterized protein BGZ61DRAFT_437017 [Ilyonectria robusta]KAH8736776.1 hypothetical protein BGZ61DRAFT_437017 [Ilyonectria robusta]